MKLIRADYIFIGALILLIGAHMTTNFLIWHLEDVAEKVGIAKEVVLQYEANPVAKFFLGLQGFKLIFSYVIAPGLLTGLYWFIRRQYAHQGVVIEAYAVSFFMFAMLDFLNDISIAMGLWL